MRVLLSGSGGTLFEALAADLGQQHDVRVLRWSDADGNLTSVEVASAAVSGRDAIVHCVPGAEDSLQPEQLVYQGALSVYNLLTASSPPERFVLLSTLDLFESYPLSWRVTEEWEPRPTTLASDLAAMSAEVVLREAVRVLPVKGLALRLAEVVTSDAAPSPRAVHVEDAVRAVRLALEFQPAGNDSSAGWWPFHIIGAGDHHRFSAGPGTRKKLGYVPIHDVAGGVAPVVVDRQDSWRVTDREASAASSDEGTRVTRKPKVVVFGALGPLGSQVAELLDQEYILRLTDVVSLEDAMRRPPFSRGAPVPTTVRAPHEYRIVDVTDPRAVYEATAGMDMIVNLSCLRSSPEVAFRVNLVGALNVLNAALECGIRRVVHTGPEVYSGAQQGRKQSGYWSDFGIPADAPPRPGTSLYFVSKTLSYVACRVFAHERGLEVPALVYGNFGNPEDADTDILDDFPICVSWRDGAEAVRRALAVPTYREPFEMLAIVADLPQNKLSNAAAKAALGWAPVDSFEAYWTRDV